MLVSGGLAMILADRWLGWPDTYRLMGALLAAFALVSLLAPRLPDPEGAGPVTPAWRELAGFAAMLAAGIATWAAMRALPWGALEADRFGRLLVLTASLLAAFAAAIKVARLAGFAAFVEPWDRFFDRRGALALLALIVLYKLGDAFAGSLSTAFLIRGAGFSQTEVGAVNKIFGLIATLVGALAGGAWLMRASLYRALLLFGLLQAVSNLGYWVLSVLPPDRTLMAAAVGFENLCGGMGTAAFVAFLMTLTDARYSAAQFALLSALAAIGRVYVGPTSGVLVEAWGWPTFFLFSTVAALPGLLLLAWLRPTIESLQTEKAT
jgi:PAT family beta-lactamase induction signal transducer AmpG